MKNTVKLEYILHKDGNKEISDKEYVQFTDAFFKVADKLNFSVFGISKHINDSEIE